MYENQAVRLNFNIGIDTADTQSIILKYRKPDGVEEEFTSVQVLNASTGDCYVDVPNDVLTPVGIWTFWSFVKTLDGNEFPGDPFTIIVESEGVSITNPEFVKSYNPKITATDKQLGLLIKQMEQLYLKIRNKPWDKDAEGNVVYPIGSDITIADMIAYRLSNGAKTITGERTMSYSYSTDGKTAFGFPASIIAQIDRYMGGK